MVQRGQLENYQPEALRLERPKETGGRFDFLGITRHKPEAAAAVSSKEESGKSTIDQKWEKAWAKKKR